MSQRIFHLIWNISYNEMKLSFLLRPLLPPMMTVVVWPRNDELTGWEFQWPAEATTTQTAFPIPLILLFNSSQSKQSGLCRFSQFGICTQSKFNVIYLKSGIDPYSFELQFLRLPTVIFESQLIHFAIHSSKLLNLRMELNSSMHHIWIFPYKL